jgi:WD40 repeat protein
MQTIVKIRGGLQKGIANLSFSPSGKYLVGCAVDDNHMVGVYDAELGALIGIEKGDTAPIIALKFKNDSEFVSVGPKHYKYWSVQNKVLKGKRGQFGDGNNSLKCVTFNGENAIVGAADGSLQTWSGASYGKSYPRHKGTLDALYVNKFVVSGGADGNIHVMDKKSYDIINTISLKKIASDSVSPKLRSVAFDENETTLVVGTYGSEIYTLSTS